MSNKKDIDNSRIQCPEKCPKVSILIPAFNCEKYIGETVNCLLKQTYRNIEVIVVDDGSTDNTSNILKNIADQRFQFVRQSNKGASSARNEAYKLSVGEFIKFMDADDLINSVCIDEQVQKILAKSGCVCSSKWGRFNQDDISTFTFSPEPVWKDLSGVDWIVNSLISNGINMTQPGIFLMPREIINKVGLWNETLNLIDDFEFMTRVIVNASQVLFCEEAVLMYRSGINNTLSRQNSRQHNESAFRAQCLGVKEILKIRNDAESRLACANSLQAWAFNFYPSHLDLYEAVDKQIIELGGSDIKMDGGKFFLLMKGILGWKKAKRLKLFFYKYGYEKLIAFMK